MKTTTTFTSGNSQAVRIPTEFRLNAKKVNIERKGPNLIISPIPEANAWPEGYIESLLNDPVDETFVRAPQGEHEKRLEF